MIILQYFQSIPYKPHISVIFFFYFLISGHFCWNILFRVFFFSGLGARRYLPPVYYNNGIYKGILHEQYLIWKLIITMTDGFNFPSLNSRVHGFGINCVLHGTASERFAICIWETNDGKVSSAVMYRRDRQNA